MSFIGITFHDNVYRTIIGNVFPGAIQLIPSELPRNSSLEEANIWERILNVTDRFVVDLNSSRYGREFESDPGLELWYLPPHIQQNTVFMKKLKWVVGFIIGQDLKDEQKVSGHHLLTDDEELQEGMCEGRQQRQMLDPFVLDDLAEMPH